MLGGGDTHILGNGQFFCQFGNLRVGDGGEGGASGLRLVEGADDLQVDSG